MTRIPPIIGQAVDRLFGASRILNYRSLGGGCINEAARVETNNGLFFIKWNADCPPDMFQKERLGLDLLSASKTVRIPEVLGHGVEGGIHYLVLPFHEATARQPNYWESLGSELAALHMTESAKHGLTYPNYIGRLTQSNELHDSWVDFFSNQRLEPQLKMAMDHSLIGGRMYDQFHQLMAKLPELIPELPPSLLHGDLWSGNFMTGIDGHAWLIDPAVYYGSREMEMAFTKLFGGFDQVFYDAYRHHYNFEPGFEERVDIYNLYPLLVHLNLFGSSYLSGIRQTLQRFA